MLPDETGERLRSSHEEFERVRGRVWLERIRVGLEYRRGMREIEEKVSRARLERDQLIRKAVEAGASYREVAGALGLSHSRIQQVVNEGAAVSPR